MTREEIDALEAFVARIRAQAFEEAAQIAQACHGAGAHMPHNRVIAAAIRARASDRDTEGAR